MTFKLSPYLTAPANIFLAFDYQNYRGERGRRRVVFHSISFDKTEWHPTPQWLMRAYDLDKGAFRDFAMKDMDNVIELEVSA